MAGSKCLVNWSTKLYGVNCVVSSDLSGIHNLTLDLTIFSRKEKERSTLGKDI